MLGQHTRCDLVNLADELEHGVIGQVTESEFALGDVTGICLAQHGVAVARHDLAGFQGGPEVVCDSFVTEVATDGILHLL